MLFWFLFTLTVFAGCQAQQVPCTTGKAVCEGVESLSIVNNEYFCCDLGFNMQWKNRQVNGTDQTQCLCNRHYYVSDCIEDQLQCEGATSFTSDGVSVKCCRSGESMNSVYNSIVNGVRADYCKCIRYVTSSGGGGRAQYRRPAVQSGRDRGGAFFRGPLGFGQIAGQFLEGLGRGIHESLSSFGNGDLAPQNTPGIDSTVGPIRPTDTQPGPRPRWPLFNFQQRMFPFIQPRRIQQNIRGATNFLDRVSQNPVVMQLVDPRWWLNQDWRGMFRNDSPGMAVGEGTTVSPNIASKNTLTGQAVL